MATKWLWVEGGLRHPFVVLSSGWNLVEELVHGLQQLVNIPQTKSGLESVVERVEATTADGHKSLSQAILVVL